MRLDERSFKALESDGHQAARAEAQAVADLLHEALRRLGFTPTCRTEWRPENCTGRPSEAKSPSRGTRW
ncbi:hypothetical protein NKH77_40510 [Streptomyces sp. M19]